MRSKHRLAEFRERLDYYKVTSQSNPTTKLPENTLTHQGGFFAKVELSAKVNEDEGKRTIETVYNVYARNTSCTQITLETQIKFRGTYYEILSIETEDIYFNKLLIKQIK